MGSERNWGIKQFCILIVMVVTQIYTRHKTTEQSDR